MNLDKEIIGQKIRQIRVERGFSQEKLSEKIDISPRHMCTIENGNSLPSLETFVKISQILDIDINDFFNLTPRNTDKLRTAIYELVQTSSVPELHLIKDLILAVRKNRGKFHCWAGKPNLQLFHVHCFYFLKLIL